MVGTLRSAHSTIAVPWHTNAVSLPCSDKPQECQWSWHGPMLRPRPAGIDRAFDAGSIFKRLQSDRQRNAEVFHGYIRLASRRRMDQELQLRIWLSVRFQCPADPGLLQGHGRHADHQGTFREDQ